MEIERLKRSHVKRNILIGVIAILIISAIILNFTRAKYRSVATTSLIHSEINYTLPDLNIVAITVDGEQVDTIPEGNYELTSESYCEVNGNRDDSVKLSYDMDSQMLTVTPMTTKGTKCYLHFETATTKNVETVLGIIKVNLDTPDFSKTAQADCSGISECEETNGIYEITNNDGTSYYWRGNVDNNWVQFAGFYWRIIRINEDGSIRMIYQGTSDNTTGTGTWIQTSIFSIDSSTYDDNAYVGYMYTLNQVHGLGTDSGIKKVLDEWYEENLQTNYANYLSTEAGFCGDRTSTTTNGGAPNDTGGTGTTATYYGARYRLYTNKQPTFECPDEEHDLYTVGSASGGNKALDYPIGLITADEVAYAGGVYGTANQSYYLYTNSVYWTMSPYYFYATVGYAFVFYVFSRGGLGDWNVDYASGVRPVINLKADVQLSGSGTSTDPYTVVGA